MCQCKTNTYDANSLCSQRSCEETTDNEVESSSCPTATGIGARSDPCIENTLLNEHVYNENEMCTEIIDCVKTNTVQTFSKNISNNRFLISFFSCLLILISMLNTLLSLHTHPGNYQDLWLYITYKKDLADVNNDDLKSDEADEEESECGRSYALKGDRINGLKVNFFGISPKHGEKAQKSDIDSIEISDDHLKILTEKETHAVLRRAGVFRLQTDYISNPHPSFFPAFSSLATYLDRVQDGRVSQDEQMCYEVQRFQSYNSVPVRASPMRLAQSGFYATGSGDETRCYSCRMTYRDWRLMDQPDQIHRSMSPDCPHLNNTDRRNEPILSSAGDSDVTIVHGVIGEYPITNGSSETIVFPSEPSSTALPFSRTTTVTTATPEATTTATSIRQALTGLDISRAVYPQYRDASSRLDSYQGWGWSHVQDPQVLARAGFYYAGYRDCVRCFYCGVGLRTWERQDDPWVEHVRWRSSCDYVRLMRGEQFVIQALTKQDPSVPSASPVPPVDTQPQNSQQAIAVTGMDAVAKAEEMGFQRDLIDRAVTEMTRSENARAITSNRDTIQLETLLERLVIMNEQPMTTSPTLQNSAPSHSNTSRQPPAVNDQSTSVGATTEMGSKGHIQMGSSATLTSRVRESHTGTSADVTSSARSTPGSSSDAAAARSLTVQKHVEKGHTTAGNKGGKRLKKKRNTGEDDGSTNKTNSASYEPAALSANQERQLEEENQSLRDEGTCKICLDNPSCIVFLPCGHLVTCAECAPALRKCPICRALIRGTVRAHTVSSDSLNV